MPIVASFDGVTRRILLDPSVADGSWKPVDLFKEYLEFRRDNHQFRGFSPLIRMRGGEPKGAGLSSPRFLQLLTDDRGITTKIQVPNLGPYRTRVDGELVTDVADVDPEPFDVSNLTTPVIIDYKPSEAEIIRVSTGGGGGDLTAADIWEYSERGLTETVTTDTDSRNASKASTVGLATVANQEKINDNLKVAALGIPHNNDI